MLYTYFLQSSFPSSCCPRQAYTTTLRISHPLTFPSSTPRQLTPFLHSRPLRARLPSRRAGLPSRRLVDDVVVANAAALGRDRRRAGDLPERDARVVRAAEPVEAPVAAVLERGREAVAVGPAVDAAVPVAPAVARRSVLVGAGIELSDPLGIYCQ